MGTPAKLDLEIYRGDDYFHTLTFTDDDDPPAALNLSAYTFVAQIRDRPEKSTTILADFVIDDSDAATGVIILSLAAEDTRIAPGFWDFQVDNGTKQTWLRGEVGVIGDVSQEEI